MVFSDGYCLGCLDYTPPLTPTSASRDVMIMKTKLCRKCGEEKSLDDFSRDKTHRDGRSCECKKCKKAYKKELKAWDPKRYLALAAGCRKRYEILHPERVKAQQIKADKKRRDRDARDPEKIKARQEREARKIDKALHPEKYKALERERSKNRRVVLSVEDREKINAQNRAKYANDPEFRAKEKTRDKRRRPQQREAYRKRRDRDPEGFWAKQRAWSAKNRKRINALQRSYRDRDPEKARARSRKHHHKKKGEQIGLMLLKALDIIKDELIKDDHEEKLEKARAKENARRAKDGARRDAWHPEKLIARQEREARRKDKALHPEKYLAQAREYSLAYYYKNREKILAKAKADYAKNPEKYHAYQRKHKDKAIMNTIMPIIAAIIKTKTFERSQR